MVLIRTLFSIPTTRSGHAPTRKQPARLIIADGHELARAGLRVLLRGARDIEIIADTATGQEALELCRDFAPDLILMDVRLADMDGLRATRLIHENHPRTRVVLYTLYEGPEYVAEAEHAGASGYVLKGASRAEVLHVIRQALAE